MVEQARKKGIYKQFLTEVMAAEQMSIAKDNAKDSAMVVKQVKNPE